MQVRSILGILIGLALALSSGMVLAPARADIEQDMVAGQDRPGGDIQSFELDAPDPGLCRQACDGRANCRSWTFVKPGVQARGAMCWLKNQVGQPSFDADAISGVAPGSGGPAPGAASIEPGMRLGIDAGGHDFSSFALASADPALCRRACDAQSACVAWTFVKPGVQGPGAMCWLKDSTPASPTANNATISGSTTIPVSAASPAPPAAAPPLAAMSAPADAGAWGVWAYRNLPPFDWTDPCGIQYVAAPVLGNRFDADAGNYRRVRTRATQPQADLDINQFGRFALDQPDGVVKMTSCETDTPPAGGPAGAGGAPGGAGPTPTVAVNWQGTYNTDWGVMVLGGGGGTFAYQNGKIDYAKVDGDTVEGIWRQDHSSQRCPDGGYWGKFEFTFTARGFSGAWGYCDDQPSTGWSGTRQSG